MWPTATKAASVPTLSLIKETLCEQAEKQSSQNLCYITEETSEHFSCLMTA